MKIPKRLKVGRKWYKVYAVKYMDKKGIMGSTNYDAGAIFIATHSNVRNVQFKREEVSDTFWHELTHAILKDMGSKLEANETFVTNFAHRLNNAIISARFN